MFLHAQCSSSVHQWNVVCGARWRGARCRHSVTPEPSPESESMEWHSSVFALGRDAETRAGKPRNIIAIIATVHPPHCAEPGPGQCSSQFLLFVSVWRGSSPASRSNHNKLSFKLPFVCDFCFYFLQGGGLCTRKLSLKRSEVQCHNNLLSIWYIFFTYTRGGFQ